MIIMYLSTQFNIKMRAAQIIQGYTVSGILTKVFKMPKVPYLKRGDNMPAYKYKAMSASGQIIEGTYTGNSKEDVLNMLRQNKNYPVSVQEVIETKDIKSLSLFKHVKTKDIAILCRQFHTMMNAGVSIINCLDILRQQIESKKLRAVVGEVYEIVQKGFTLSEAMKKHQEVFPDLLINMVAAGEASGNLDTIMDRMASHFEKEDKINRKVKGAMMYPAVLSVVAMAVVIFLLTFVMPTFVTMFQSSGVKLPTPTVIVLAVSNGVKKFWYAIILIIAALSYAVVQGAKSQSGKLFIDSMKFKIPVINKMTQKIITSRFSRTLATLMSSGMPLLQALEIVSKVVGNRVAAEGILKAKDEVRKGANLSAPIKKLGVFPPMLVSMLTIGEESGALDDILDRTANYYDDEVEAAMENVTKLIEPIMLVIMAVVVGFIVMAMILPIFDMMNTIKVS